MSSSLDVYLSPFHWSSEKSPIHCKTVFNFKKKMIFCTRKKGIEIGSKASFRYGKKKLSGLMSWNLQSDSRYRGPSLKMIEEWSVGVLWLKSNHIPMGALGSYDSWAPNNVLLNKAKNIICSGIIYNHRLVKRELYYHAHDSRFLLSLNFKKRNCGLTSEASKVNTNNISFSFCSFFKNCTP